MNKVERQDRIKRIIQLHHVGTQEEIKLYLEQDDIFVTQATLSRDLREIGLMKLRDENGHLYYSLSENTQPLFAEIIRQYVLSVSRAEFMLVLHTNLGEADVLANIVDGQHKEEILGTVAGADTLLLICKDAEVAEILEKEIEESL